MSAFGAWEAFLFDLAVELMAGAQTQDWYRHYCRTKTHFPSLAAARAQLLCTRLTGNTVNILAAPRNYLLLHHPSAVIQIVNYWLIDSPIAHIFQARQTDIERVMTIRHGIAHGTAHAKDQLRATLLHFEPFSTFGRAGEFLLFRPIQAAQMYYEIFESWLYEWATAMSP